LGEGSRGSEGKVSSFILSYSRLVYIIPGDLLVEPTLFSGSGPVGLPPVPWTEENNWKVAIFLPTRRSLLPERPGWTDNILNFYWVSCKS